MAVDPNVIDMGLPPEYQAQIDAEKRKQAIAQALLQQSMQFKGAENPNGKIAARTSPLAWLANAATSYLGGQALSQGDQAIAGVRKNFNTAQTQEATRIQGLPAEEQVNQGLLSQFPLVQQQAQALRKNQQDLREKVITAAGTAGNSDMIAHVAGGGSLKDYTAATQKPPEFGQDAKGNSYAKVYDKNGVATIHYAPQGLQFNMPGKEGETTLGILKEDLFKRQGSADAAKSALSSNTFALDALQNGAQAGGGEAIKQSFRKGLQAFNIQTPENTPTEQLGMALGNAVLSNAEKIRPASDTDIIILKKMVGEISTDPTALVRALAFSNALSLKTLHGYNNYVDSQKTNLKTDYARDLFSGAGIGYEVPKQLAGPIGSQFETVKHFQNLGGDPSIFQINGEAVKPGTQFNVNPLLGMSGVEGKTPPPVEGKKIVRTGRDATTGQRVTQYSDGTIVYADK
jgi:hypothetical protein